MGKDAFNIEGCWEAMRKPSNNILRDRKLAMCAQACVDSALWDAVGKALGDPLYKLWGGYADRLPVDVHRRILRREQDARRFRPRNGGDQPAATLAANSRSGAGLRRRTPSACASPARRRRRFHPDGRRQPGLEPARSRRIFARGRGVKHALVRGAGALAKRPARHGGGAQSDRNSGLRRAERDQPRRLPRPDDVRRDRRLQFRRELGRRPHRMAPRRRAGRRLRSTNGPSRRAADRRASALVGRQRHISGNVSPDRDPLFYALVANRSKFDDGYYATPQGAGFGLELDPQTIKKYHL